MRKGDGGREGRDGKDIRLSNCVLCVCLSIYLSFMPIFIRYLRNRRREASRRRGAPPDEGNTLQGRTPRTGASDGPTNIAAAPCLVMIVPACRQGGGRDSSQESGGVAKEGGGGGGGGGCNHEQQQGSSLHLLLFFKLCLCMYV